MITRVTNHGDTLGIRFPKSLWKDVHISENDSVEVQVSRTFWQTKERKKPVLHVSINPDPSDVLTDNNNVYKKSPTCFLHQNTRTLNPKRSLLGALIHIVI
jgi:hypothetical protein